MSIRRGTTPKIQLKVKGIDLDDISDCYVSIKQNQHILTKVAECEDGLFQITLTQEESLEFNANNVQVQMKMKTNDDNVIATNIVVLPMKEILNEDIL